MPDRSATSTLAVRVARLIAPRLLRRFVRQRRATSSVEFALVASPLIALALGTIQTGTIFLASQSLETAAAYGARLILTGQAQTQNWTAAQFKQQICSQITAIFDCSGGVYVDVESYPSFSAANLALPISNGTFNTGALGYNPGGPGSVVVLRLYYQYPVFFSALKLNNLTNGSDLFAATAVFQNEPYGSS